MLKYIYHFFGLVLSLLVATTITQAQNSQNHTRELTSLKGKWLYFSNTYSSFIPYTAGITAFNTNVSTWIDARHYRQWLEFQSSPDLCLYANNKLFFSYNTCKQQSVSLAYLKETLKTDKIFLTFYQPNGLLPTDNCIIVSQPSHDSAQLQRKNSAILKGIIKKPAKSLNETSIFIIFSVVIFYVLLKNIAPANFYGLFQISGFFEQDQEKYNNSIYRIDNIFTIMILTTNVLSISYIVYLVARPTNLTEQISELLFFSTAQLNGFFLFINFIVLGVLYLFGKFLLIQAIGTAFNLQKLIPMHYYEFVRFSTVLGILSLFLSLLCFGGQVITVQQLVIIIEVLVMIFFIARCLKVSILLSNWPKFHTVYLFSYLCATEILPIMVMVHMALGFHENAVGIE